MSDMNNAEQPTGLKKIFKGVFNFLRKYVLHTEVEWTRNQEQHSEKLEDFVKHRSQESSADKHDNEETK
jgi:hypothetical protein